MFFTPDVWLALGAVVLVGSIIVGFSLCVGKSIIWLFGTESEIRTPVHRAEEAEKPIIREAA